MPDDKALLKRPAPVWASYGPDYAVEKYDFTRWPKSNPPPVDADPDIRPFPHTKRAPQV